MKKRDKKVTSTVEIKLIGSIFVLESGAETILTDFLRTKLFLTIGFLRTKKIVLHVFCCDFILSEMKEVSLVHFHIWRKLCTSVQRKSKTLDLKPQMSTTESTKQKHQENYSIFSTRENVSSNNIELIET
jgi:hypothetical protein